MGRSPWGSVRKLPSGRFQARYCVDLVWHNAPTTYRTKREADAYLASVRADVDRGSWIPDAGKVTFEEYSARRLAERPQLRPRTRELYEGQLRLHILPVLGENDVSGAPLRRATLYTARRRATRSVGIAGLGFLDLRHTGNTLAASTGASTNDMTR